MAYPLEVADVFRAHGPAWRLAQRGHLSLGQLKVMSAITQCRSAALGGHVLACPACTHQEIAYDLHSSRVVISRLLKKLEQMGKIEIHRNYLKILDL